MTDNERGRRGTASSWLTRAKKS